MSKVQDLYSHHFGMTGRPFSPLADSRTVHWSSSHTRAYGALEYGLFASTPFTVLTGAEGSGKTSLLLKLMADASEENRIAMVAGLRPGIGSIIPWVLQALGEDVAADASEVSLFGQLQSVLIDEYAAGRTTVLIFDEAQNLGDAALDELRLLSNINTAQDQLLQTILCGLPVLRTTLRSSRHAGLAQRVGAWGHLDALDEDGTAEYLVNRLAAVGGRLDLIESAASDTIHQACGGTPRLINQLSELAMIYAMTSGADQVTEATVRQVLADGLFVATLPNGESPAALRLASGGT